MSRKYESGSVHAIVIGILILALVGAVGFIFWQNFLQNKDDTQTEGKTSSVTGNSETKPAARTAADWTRFEGDGFSFAIPDGWSLTLNTDSGVLYAASPEKNLVYKEGTPAVITKVSESGGDSGPGGLFVKTQIVAPSTFNGSETFKSDTAVSIAKVSASTDYFGTAYSDHHYQFTVPGQKDPIQVSYTVKSSDKDYSQQLETGLKQLRLN